MLGNWLTTSRTLHQRKVTGRVARVSESLGKALRMVRDFNLRLELWWLWLGFGLIGDKVWALVVSGGHEAGASRVAASALAFALGASSWLPRLGR